MRRPNRTRSAASEHSGRRPPRGRVLLNTAYLAVGEVIAKLGTMVLLVVMARTIGSSDFGVFTFALSFAALATTLAAFGQDAILTREVARRRSSIHPYFVNTLSLKAVLVLPSLGLALFILSQTKQDEDMQLVALLIGIAVSAELLTKTTFATFQAYERLEFLPIGLVAHRGFTVGTGVAALLAGAGVVVIAAIYLLGALLAFSVSLMLLLRFVVRPRLVVRLGAWPGLMRAAFAIGLFTLFATTIFQVDTVILAFFEPNAVVGNYGAAHRLLESTLFLSWSVGAAVYPIFSRLRPNGEAALADMLERALKLAVASVLPVAVLAATLAHPIVVTLYGAEFEDASLALVLLAPAIALYPVAYVGGYLLIAQDRQRLLPIIYACVAAQHIASCLVLIPMFSMYGAAAATSLSQMLLAVPLLILSCRVVGRFAWARVFAGPTLACIASVGVIVIVGDKLVVATVVSAVAYVTTLLLWELKMFPQDVRDLVAVRKRWTGDARH